MECESRCPRKSHVGMYLTISIIGTINKNALYMDDGTINSRRAHLHLNVRSFHLQTLFTYTHAPPTASKVARRVLRLTRPLATLCVCSVPVLRIANYGGRDQP